MKEVQKKVSWWLRLPSIILVGWFLLFFFFEFLNFIKLDTGGLLLLWVFASILAFRYVFPIIGIWSLVAGIILFKRKQSLAWAIANIITFIIIIIIIIFLFTIAPSSMTF